jgi:hypothetical protein
VKLSNVVPVFVVIIPVVLFAEPISIQLDQYLPPSSSVAGLDVIATIGEYIITTEHLRNRYLLKIQEYTRSYFDPNEQITFESVLLEVLSEKAVILNGIANNVHAEPLIKNDVQREVYQRLVLAQLNKYLSEHLTISDEEVQQKIKDNPELDIDKATSQIRQEKTQTVLYDYYVQLIKDAELKKHTNNIQKAVEIYNRLLKVSATELRVNWIQETQIESDLTDEERNLILLQFKAGEITIEDWLRQVCRLVPIKRPAELNTVEGIENFLGQNIKEPIIAAEAIRNGLDKDPEFLQYIRNYQDRLVLTLEMSKLLEKITEITDEQIQEFYNCHKYMFVTNPNLTVKQIWCDRLEEINQVKKLLDEGGDFDSLLEEYSIAKNTESYEIFFGNERPFSNQIWKAQQGDTVGPIPGSYGTLLKWRLIKIVSKEPAQINELNPATINSVRSAIFDQLKNRLMSENNKKLFEKYHYNIDYKKLRSFDPAVEP